jgi:hypothetical protein
MKTMLNRTGWRRLAAGLALAALGAAPLRAVWPPPEPKGPFADGMAVAGSKAPDEPIPGFTGSAGVGVAPIWDGPDEPIINPGQTVNPAFVGWPTNVTDYSPSNPDTILYDNATVALQPVSGEEYGEAAGDGGGFSVVSLGDLTAEDIKNGVPPGSITLQFAGGIADGPGPDFAVYNNAFQVSDTQAFMKLAYVEVSTDGVNFARFPSVDTNPKPPYMETYDDNGDPVTLPDWPYATEDPTKIYNLAGKAFNNYGVSWGVPFDLAELADNPAVLNGTVDLYNINFVRLVDVPGSGAFQDAYGDPIYDPWLTFYDSAYNPDAPDSPSSPGFQLEAIGVLNDSTPTVPVFTTEPAGATVEAGADATFTGWASGPPAPSYQWQISTAEAPGWSNLTDDGTFAGSQTDTLTVSGVTPDLSGAELQCVATNSAGNATSDTVTLTVVPREVAAYINTAPANASVKAGAKASFSANVTGSPTPRLQWQYLAPGTKSWANLANGGAYQGVTTATLVVSASTALSGAQFRLVATNSAGSMVSAAAKLAVAPAGTAPKIVTAPKAVKAKAGATVKFTVKASGAAPLKYQWQWKNKNLPNGSGVAGATTATLTVAKVSAARAGAYRVIVSNAAGSATSAAATLAVP